MKANALPSIIYLSLASYCFFLRHQIEKRGEEEDQALFFPAWLLVGFMTRLEAPEHLRAGAFHV
jgi:hypothetical protein